MGTGNHFGLLLVGVAAGALHPFVCGCAPGGFGMSATSGNDSCGELVHSAEATPGPPVLVVWSTQKVLSTWAVYV
jgi:hypothetical protein